jgi:hypothetical protein
LGVLVEVPGDFSEAVPAGGDAYLLKWLRLTRTG